MSVEEKWSISRMEDMHKSGGNDLTSFCLETGATECEAEELESKSDEKLSTSSSFVINWK